MTLRHDCVGCVVIAAVVVLAACDSGNAGGSCQCTPGGDQCGTDYWCDGCYCHLRCDGPEDCPDPLLPNCGADGWCLGPCDGPEDCTNLAYPNCDPATGLCQGPCPGVPCPDAYPNCDPATGLCQGPCPATPCPEGFPNCDPTPGLCLPPCDGNEDCYDEQPECDRGTGLCFDPECTTDAECSPPTTVCEDFACVPGCTRHADCDALERCDLVDAGHLYHCEPRDCLVDDDCDPPTTVCDTDGLADPAGGGYCVPGCETHYDCPLRGYDCEDATGACVPHDYGDIGQACGLGCASGFCLTDASDLCTGFCCVQHDCPAGWGCRPHDDGTGNGHEVKVCVPLAAGAGALRLGEPCTADASCLSGWCNDWLHQCSETCCTDPDCAWSFAGVPACIHMGGNTFCQETPLTDASPLGAPGCGTSGAPIDCRSNLCYSQLITDTACTSDASCPASRPTCWDYYSDGTTDCVKDYCNELCCGEADCPSYGADKFYCGKITYGAGDHNVCLLHEGAGTKLEGEACASAGECRSRFCAGAPAGTCRARCCDDADCQHASYPSCRLELHAVSGTNRRVNVCLPAL